MMTVGRKGLQFMGFEPWWGLCSSCLLDDGRGEAERSVLDTAHLVPGLLHGRAISNLFTPLNTSLLFSFVLLVFRPTNLVFHKFIISSLKSHTTLTLYISLHSCTVQLRTCASLIISSHPFVISLISFTTYGTKPRPSVGPVARPVPTQGNTFTKDKHACPTRHSNPRSSVRGGQWIGKLFGLCTSI
jgi:hypothetical protein